MPRIAQLAPGRRVCSRVNVASGKLEDVPLFASDTSSLLGGSGPSTSSSSGLTTSKAAAPSLDSVELKSGVSTERIGLKALDLGQSGGGCSARSQTRRRRCARARRRPKDASPSPPTNKPP